MVSQVALRASAMRRSVGIEMRRDEMAVTAVSRAGSTCISAAPVLAAGSGFWAAGKEKGELGSERTHLGRACVCHGERPLHCSKQANGTDLQQGSQHPIEQADEARRQAEGFWTAADRRKATFWAGASQRCLLQHNEARISLLDQVG